MAGNCQCRQSAWLPPHIPDHSKCFRNRVAGFHSNDIESEFNRLRRWLRQRYGQLKLNAQAPGPNNAEAQEFDDLDLYEYMFYSNVGKDMSNIMAAFSHYNGGRCEPVNL